MIFTNNFGDAPVISAAGEGHIEVVKCLYEAGAEANVARVGLTPVKSAGQEYHIRVVKYLYEAELE